MSRLTGASTREALARLGVLVVLGVLVWALFTALSRLDAANDDRARQAERLVELSDLVRRTGEVLDGAVSGLADAEDLKALRADIRAATTGVAPAQTMTGTTPSTSTPPTTATPIPEPTILRGPRGPQGPPGVSERPSPSSVPSPSCSVRLPLLDVCL